jgi:aspartate aminotransferase-like enzyme
MTRSGISKVLGGKRLSPDFYDYLAARGFIIYPGKMTRVPTFRIGSIGEIYPKDIQALSDLIVVYLEQRGVKVPIHYN